MKYSPLMEFSHFGSFEGRRSTLPLNALSAGFADDRAAREVVCRRLPLCVGKALEIVRAGGQPIAGRDLSRLEEGRAVVAEARGAGDRARRPSQDLCGLEEGRAVVAGAQGPTDRARPPSRPRSPD